MHENQVWLLAMVTKWNLHNWKQYVTESLLLEEGWQIPTLFVGQGHLADLCLKTKAEYSILLEESLI